jgi:DNA-binding MarR family transcriptional regulator
MRAGPDAERLEAWRLLLRVHACVLAHLDLELEATCHLPLTWYDALVYLDATPGQRLRLQDLVGALPLSKSGLSRLIARMEEAGLVARQDCPQDRRGIFAALTPAGRAALEQARPVYRAVVAAQFAQHLSGDETAALQSAFRKILEGVREKTRRTSSLTVCATRAPTSGAPSWPPSQPE